jgi:hypothetical protein
MVSDSVTVRWPSALFASLVTFTPIPGCRQEKGMSAHLALPSTHWLTMDTCEESQTLAIFVSLNFTPYQTP